jgi:peptidoglycan hydrolase-like protein with peptidoglycan-binding domain
MAFPPFQNISNWPHPIREAQVKLNQKGFNVGEPDGVMGPKTKDALAQFQRQQGLQASGEIDSETADALGVSGGSSTTGSAPRNR